MGSGPASLKPKSKFPTAVVAVLVLGGAGFGGWKYSPRHSATDDARDDGRATRPASSTSS